MWRIASIFLFAGMIAAVIVPAAIAQGGKPSRTVLDGVYTAAQAQRGSEAYAANCSSCHSKDLAGQAGPPLKGDVFIDNWREDGLNILYDYIRMRMPQRKAGSLSQQAYLDILAFILSENMIPSGSGELTADVVENTVLVGKDGPGSIPKFALVSVVGCLAKSDDEWRLEKASAPVRRHDEKPAREEVQTSGARALGKGSYRLVYVDSMRPAFVPERNAGHKLHVQGYLLSNDKGEGISVTWLESVGASCTGQLADINK